MRKFKRIPEDWVRLYVIEVAMALQHLHDMDVVYRDLKPENILLCGDGHLKLTDFGLSRFFETRPPAPEDMLADDNIVTRSFCGTEQYMSPEMLLQQVIFDILVCDIFIAIDVQLSLYNTYHRVTISVWIGGVWVC